ncbi:divalent-cation tolerance protein CutA [Microvirga makkahensis]|uniref:Divalent cation tolerance protein CutA n=1 Tax=Microvirga makkahensis TaxID=1128670 RepID=A0A7X3MMW6_9HYPH|nr:divalent-cation tolerance protein CutA [Microvirga makkahensis]MXQ09923.1 divalent cation tolerance protein CutA [Microvirga makkahensis]
MERPLLVYTTFPDVDTALEIGEGLVRDGLIACINVLPGMRSVYAWKGTVERGEEAVGILKTRKGLQERVQEALRGRHPYETPVIFFIEPAGTDAATLDWLLEETAGERE